MRNMIMAAFILVSAVFFTACQKEESSTPNPTTDPNFGKEFVASVGVGAGGSIAISEDEQTGAGMTSITSLIKENGLSEEELAKRPFTGNELIGIQVKENKYCLSGTESPLSEARVVAAGFWKLGQKEKLEGAAEESYVLNNLKVRLRHGYTYTVEATIICDKEIIENNDASIMCFDVKQGEGADVRYSKDAKTTSTDWAKTSDLDEETTVDEFLHLSKSLVTTSDNKGEFERGRRFYFINETFAADFDNPIIAIELKCMSVKFNYTFANMNYDEGYSAIIGFTTTINGERQSFTETINSSQLVEQGGTLITTSEYSEWYTPMKIKEIYNGSIKKFEIKKDLDDGKYHPLKAELKSGDNIVKTIQYQTGDVDINFNHSYKLKFDFGENHDLDIKVDETVTYDDTPIELEDIAK